MVITTPNHQRELTTSPRLSLQSVSGVVGVDSAFGSRGTGFSLTDSQSGPFPGTSFTELFLFSDDLFSVPFVITFFDLSYIEILQKSFKFFL